MENNNPQFFTPQDPVPPQAPVRFPGGKRELLFAGLLLLCGWLLCNSLFFAGANLGFAIFTGVSILLSILYLLTSGKKLTVYSGLLLGLSLVICGSFARSDDGFVKFVMVLFLLLSVNLGLCILAGQNLRAPRGFTSLLDAPRAAFSLALGKLNPALGGLFQGLRTCGSAGKKSGPILLGLVIAIPLLLIIVPLLISADAAFDALMQNLPQWDFGEFIPSVLLGTLLAGFLFSRGAALNHAEKTVPAPKVRKGLNPLTVNTVLVAIAVVYLLYLFSQLAYFSGGFSGILPEDYTVAQYARRGFFELAWLCAVNLAIVACGAGLVRGKAPLLTRLICLFIGIVTVFLAVSASAKMFLYIGSFGLTRLRVLTQVIIFWLGLTTVLVCIWLFVPKLPYMKAVVILALALGAAVAWADVDTVVARYNVTAYQSGALQSVDVSYLDSLGNGAIPYIAQLKDDDDIQVSAAVLYALTFNDNHAIDDFRDWNYVNQIAGLYVKD